MEGTPVNQESSRHQLSEKIYERESKKDKSNHCEYWA